MEKGHLSSLAKVKKIYNLYDFTVFDGYILLLFKKKILLFWFYIEERLEFLHFARELRLEGYANVLMIIIIIVIQHIRIS